MIGFLPSYLHFNVYYVYLLYLLYGSSHTVKALWYGLPFTGEFDHASSIQHTITKQMVELQAHTVPSPLVNLIVQFVPLRRKYSQVLQVSPGQVWTTHTFKRQKRHYKVDDCKFNCCCHTQETFKPS